MAFTKKNIRRLFFIVVTVVFTSLPQNSKTMPEFQQELHVVSDTESYKNTTLLDTNQQLIGLQGFLTLFYTDFKYATNQNFTKEVLYTQPEPYLRLPAAKALKNALSILKSKGLTLKIYDAYRPYSVTKKMWKIVPDDRYAADPAKGSSHNRGTAVDVTLVYLKTGVELEMPTEFDNFTTKAHHNYRQLPKKVIKNRALLKWVMEQAGFVALDTEWWHYALKGSGEKFHLLDLDFNQVKQVAKVWNN